MNRQAEQIKTLLSMSDVLNKYGMQPDYKGFLCCPFHEEKTPSFSIYNHGKNFKCFGCGESGSVIDFTMKLFGISFSQAIIRLNTDFGLGLTNEKPDLRTRNELIRKKTEEASRKAALSAQRKRLILRRRKLWQNYIRHKPCEIYEPLKAEFVEALHNIEYIDYLLLDLEEQEAKRHGNNQRIQQR